MAEVNLDFECREIIEENLENPTSSIFDEAKLVVLDLIKYDLYLKFIDSDIYRNFKGNFSLGLTTILSDLSLSPIINLLPLVSL